MSNNPDFKGLTLGNQSEEMTVSSTGSLRQNSGKPRPTLIDPEFIMGLAEVLKYGGNKYGDPLNWMKGNDYTVPLDSAIRHLMAYQKGENFDKESNLHHLLHVATNIMFLYYYDRHFKEGDNRPFKGEK